MIDKLKIATLYFFSFLIVAGMIYGCYWVAKTVSYEIFYEDMVMDTVRDMVKPDALK